MVFELFETVSENNTITEGARQVIGVMVKDLDRFQDTKGWGFEAFKLANPDKRLVTDMNQQCFLPCHKTQGTNDYVYTRYRN